MKSIIDISSNLISATLCDPVDEMEMQSIISYLEGIMNENASSYNLLVDLSKGGHFSSVAMGMLKNFYTTYGNRVDTMVLIVAEPGYAEVVRILLEQNRMTNFQIVNNKDRAMALLAS